MSGPIRRRWPDVADRIDLLEGVRPWCQCEAPDVATIMAAEPREPVRRVCTHCGGAPDSPPFQPDLSLITQVARPS